MDDFTKDFNWSQAAKSLTVISEQVNEALSNIGNAMMIAFQPLFVSIAHFPIRFPQEHPVDYVLRRGPDSGYSIYPDEAWRFRANLDWWQGDDTADQWGKKQN
jgi:hypothetical protein